MAEEIKKDEIFLRQPHLLHIVSERIYLTRSASDKVLPFSVYGLPTINRIALDVLAPCRLYQFFQGTCDEMLSPTFLSIVANTDYLISFAQQVFADFKANATRTALLLYLPVIAPCRIAHNRSAVLGRLILDIGTDIPAQSAMDAFVFFCDERLVEPFLIEMQNDDMHRARLSTYAAAIAIMDV